MLGRNNLTVLTEARTLKLLVSGTQITGVRYQHKTSEEEAFAREVIVCAGTAQSPQILQLSGIGAVADLEPHGIRVVMDLPGVGKNLQDHLDVVVQQYCNRNDVTLDKYARLHRMIPVFLKYLFFGSGPASENPLEAGGFVKTRPDLDAPDIQLHFIPVLMLDHGRQRGSGPGMCIHVCQLRPESRGEIKLRSANPFDDPLIKPNYLDSENDLAVLTQGVKVARKIFASGPLSSLLGGEHEYSRGKDTDEEIKEFIRSTAETIYHPVGTCKMGNDSLAVVDDRLRVHGMQGLRVVDASIMPTLVGGNTNAPTIMIAEKAADMILSG